MSRIWFTVMATMLMTGGASAHGPDDRPPPTGEPAGLPGPITGSIEITNERDRSVQIYIDGRFVLELRARTTDTLERVPNGIRLVSYVGSDGARAQTDRVEVREGRRASLRIAPLRGQVAIVNRAEVDMRVTLGEIELGVVRAGRDLITPPMPAATYRLVAAPIGWKRVAPQSQEVIVVAGETVRAEIRPLAATLVVSNPFPRAVVVFIDGQRVTKLGRLESERVQNLEPGPARVELRDDRRVLAAEVIDLAPGRESYFAPQLVRYGSLEVRNPSRRAVRITLDGKAGFRLSPGASRTIGDLEAGRLVVQVTLDDGRIVKHDTDIVPGETQLFQVPLGWFEPDYRPR